MSQFLHSYLTNNSLLNRKRRKGLGLTITKGKNKEIDAKKTVSFYFSILSTYKSFSILIIPLRNLAFCLSDSKMDENLYSKALYPTEQRDWKTLSNC